MRRVGCLIFRAAAKCICWETGRTSRCTGQLLCQAITRRQILRTPGHISRPDRQNSYPNTSSPARQRRGFSRDWSLEPPEARLPSSFHRSSFTSASALLSPPAKTVSSRKPNTQYAQSQRALNPIPRAAVIPPHSPEDRPSRGQQFPQRQRWPGPRRVEPQRGGTPQAIFLRPSANPIKSANKPLVQPKLPCLPSARTLPAVTNSPFNRRALPLRQPPPGSAERARRRRGMSQRARWRVSRRRRAPFPRPVRNARRKTSHSTKAVNYLPPGIRYPRPDRRPPRSRAKFYQKKRRRSAFHCNGVCSYSPTPRSAVSTGYTFSAMRNMPISLG